ncbi:MAG TPA: glycosyltransferase family 4 protein [Vicinamibacterales bacterium]|nr:glycosyltransferase family 4 protein [Vicinamibacterales bacterium]
MTAVPLRVLMVTGAYHPEISSGGLQSQLMARAMRGRAEVRVLTTAIDFTTPKYSTIEGVEVSRMHLRAESIPSKVVAGITTLPELGRLVRWCDIVHIHGVSTKNILVTAMARLIGRPIVLSLHTMGADEPAVIRNNSALMHRSFQAATKYLAVSAGLRDASLAAGVPGDRIELIPNGIDIDQFKPASLVEKRALRREAGHDVHGPVILFVGYFSHDKQPRVLFDAWMKLLDHHHIDATVWFVGATKSNYFEVDERIADRMQDEAVARGRAGQLIFTGPVHEVQRYFRLADVFVLPSRREGLPVALMEAMACGLPCVASRLPGATDTLIDHGVSGLLVPPEDVDAFADAIAETLNDPARAAAMGGAARQVVLDRFASETIAARWLATYEDVLRRSAVDRP